MAVGRGRFPRIGGGQGIAPRFSNGCEPASRGARERRRPLYAEMVVILPELWSDSLWRKVDIYSDWRRRISECRQRQEEACANQREVIFSSYAAVVRLNG